MMRPAEVYGDVSHVWARHIRESEYLELVEHGPRATRTCVRGNYDDTERERVIKYVASLAEPRKCRSGSRK